MDRSFGFVAGATSLVALVVGSSGCVGLLGDIAVDDGPLDGGGVTINGQHGDAAVDPAARDATASDAKVDAPKADAQGSACTLDSDCAGRAVPETLPPACAIFVCQAHQCTLVARDDDGDGHRRATCTATTASATVQPGDDCDDTDKERYPGNWDGPSVPGDPLRPNRCGDKVDHNCNGVAGDDVVTINGATTTCTCAPNDRRRCSPGPLGCPDGLQVCGTDGKWGACTGASAPFSDPWTSNFGASGNGWSKTWGDPVVETPNDRLRLSSDDIATRDKPISGSYFISHDLTLSGGTPFTPTVYTDTPFLPSIRRSGNDMQLGGDSYGGAWDDAQPPGFGGRLVKGVLTGRVTTYVKAQSRQLAMKVEAGGAVYRSGWTPPLTWPQTNFATFRLVGQNNASIYAGADDYVYVGPLHGCSGLDDAVVESVYNQ
jgi:hypothetical protein